MKRLLTFLISFLALCSIADAQVADTVYTNGKIFTVNEKQPSAEAVAIKDGIFVRIGSANNVKPLIGREAEVVDLGGQFVSQKIRKDARAWCRCARANAPEAKRAVKIL